MRRLSASERESLGAGHSATSLPRDVAVAPASEAPVAARFFSRYAWTHARRLLARFCLHRCLPRAVPSSLLTGARESGGTAGCVAEVAAIARRRAAMGRLITPGQRDSVARVLPLSMLVVGVVVVVEGCFEGWFRMHTSKSLPIRNGWSMIHLSSSQYV